MIFHRRGSHFSVFDTTSPSLRRRTPPHLPQAQGGGSTIRSSGRLSGKGLRGGRGVRARFSLAASGADISALASTSPCVSSMSSMASSSCAISCLPRSDDCPNCSRRALASRSFNRSSSSRLTVTSLLAIVSNSRCARIIAWAAARSVGSGSEGVVTATIQPDSRQKIALASRRESIRHASSGRLWPPGFLRHPPIDSGQKIRELSNADRYNAVRHRRPQKAPALQPLREQAGTLSVMPDYFYQITATTSEDVEIARMRVPLQRLLDHERQGAESASHVGVAGRKPNPYVAVDRNHRRSSTSR